MLLSLKIKLRAHIQWPPRGIYCEIPFDVIARLETFDEDIKYIILKRNLTNLMNQSSLWLHKSKDTNLNLSNSTDVQNRSQVRKIEKNRRIMQYFGQLNKQQINDLYQMYFLDFNLFNYSATEYLEMHHTIWLW